MYIYRFLDREGNVIYIGRTSNIVRRIRNQHFTDKGHLPIECYRETVQVEYAKVNNKNESKVYELYYIEQYQPRYNNIDIGGGKLSFEMPDLKWKEYDFNDNPKLKRITKKDLASILEDLGDAIGTDCSYMREFLRGKDQVGWLDKLDNEERNEYLMMIYSMERFVNGVDDIKEEHVSKIKQDNYRGSYNGVI